MISRLLLLLAAIVPIAAGRGPLFLEDVLASVERHYPPLQAALEEGSLAEADLLIALGRFDTTLRTRLDSTSLSDYDNRRFDIGIEQPLRAQGSSLFGGYRLGDGSFASYDGGLLTRDNGEWRSGFRLPLLRDRTIDSRRAELRKAEWGRVLARLSVEQQRLVIVQSATRRYWDWVAAGRRFSVTQSVLEIAERRDVYLREQVAAGALPRFDVEDNARIMLQRRSQVIEAERALAQAAIELSLFYRDDQGQPILADAGQAPDFPVSSALPQDQLAQDIAAAWRKRPELGRFAAQVAQNTIDADLARNQRLPAVDLVTSFAQDLGYQSRTSTGIKVPRAEWKTGLLFEWSWQQRQAKGRLLGAQARARQLEQRRRFTQDQIRAEVQDARSAVHAAAQRAALLREEVEATRRVEDAERQRFELGEGTLFVLNLREQATADAALREVAARADFHRASALYQYATAEALGQP